MHRRDAGKIAGRHLVLVATDWICPFKRIRIVERPCRCSDEERFYLIQKGLRLYKAGNHGITTLATESNKWG